MENEGMHRNLTNEDGFYFQTRKLCAGYDDVPVVSNVELHLKRGEILSLIGPNGAGKTTILRSIIRQLTPIAGIAVLDGIPMFQMNSRELSKQMAVVLTERLQTEMMTVEEVVGTGRYPYTGKFGILNEHDRFIAADVMEQIHIAELKDQDFTKISDGQRQKVMLARALTQQPDIIVLDEPTSYLDIKHKMEFLSILRRLSRERNLTVIMSLHEVELAEKISDQIACFRDGHMDRYGTPEEIFSGDYLLKLYDIKLEELDPAFRTMILGKANCSMMRHSQN